VKSIAGANTQQTENAPEHQHALSLTKLYAHHKIAAQISFACDPNQMRRKAVLQVEAVFIPIYADAASTNCR